MMYGRYINGDISAKQSFFAAVEKLIDLQRTDGGFPYPSRDHWGAALPIGWVSAMAQGQALSVLSRALLLQNDFRYQRAGELAFSNLMTTVASGGAMTSLADLDPSWAGDVFFPEYPDIPDTFTLNGYMFTLLGVLDWANTVSSSKNKASSAFQNGMISLAKILPYYDIGGFSAYDLSHLTLGGSPYVVGPYLGIHVYLLHALNSVAPNNVSRKYEMIWRNKIDEMNKLLKFTSISIGSKSPQPLGAVVKITVDSEGGLGGKKLYKFCVKYKNEWVYLNDYSLNNSITWTPIEKGVYELGYFVKDESSVKDYDNFRHQTFSIQ